MRYPVILSILIFLFVAGISHAQNITLVTENYPPFQIKESGKPPQGFAIELVEAMKKYAGINEKIEVYPWARAYNMALIKPNTFIFSLARTKEREDLFKWIGDYFMATTAIYALKSRTDIVITSLEDAKNIQQVPQEVMQVRYYLKTMVLNHLNSYIIW